MLTLYSYPELCGVADNNGYGLKVFAFLRLAELPFAHEHIFDASGAPRGQLPYIKDSDDLVGDSETIIAYLLAKYQLPMDGQLTSAQRHSRHLTIRVLSPHGIVTTILPIARREVIAPKASLKCLNAKVCTRGGSNVPDSRPATISRKT